MATVSWSISSRWCCCGLNRGSTYLAVQFPGSISLGLLIYFLIPGKKWELLNNAQSTPTRLSKNDLVKRGLTCWDRKNYGADL